MTAPVVACFWWAVLPFAVVFGGAALFFVGFVVADNTR